MQIEKKFVCFFFKRSYGWQKNNLILEFLVKNLYYKTQELWWFWQKGGF